MKIYIKIPMGSVLFFERRKYKNLANKLNVEITNFIRCLFDGYIYEIKLFDDDSLEFFILRNSDKCEILTSLESELDGI